MRAHARLRAALVLAAPLASALAVAGSCSPASLDVLEPGVGTLDAGDATPDTTQTPDSQAPEASTEAAVDATPDGQPGNEASCSSGTNGLPCSSSNQCCSGWCATPGTPGAVCAPTVGCLGTSSSCSIAGACCSLACVAKQDGVGACGDSPVCAPVGAACTRRSDCCSDDCPAGSCVASSAPCKPAGETCGGPGECCGQVCNPGPGGARRCALLEGCRVQGEICTTSADCCTDVCVLDAQSVGHCAALATCTENDHQTCMHQIGEICGGNGDCCSRFCQPQPGGPKLCASSPGCGAECELCSSNADCCSGVCTSLDDIESRCQPAASNCGADGEMCGGDGDCCAPATCVPDAASVGREAMPRDDGRWRVPGGRYAVCPRNRMLRGSMRSPPRTADSRAVRRVWPPVAAARRTAIAAPPRRSACA